MRGVFGAMGGWLSRGGYTLADQILSSGTNFATAIIVARLLGPADYGSYAIAFGAWIMVMGFTRTMIVNPYVIKAAALDPEDWLKATRSAAGLSLAAGLLGCVIIATIGLFLGAGHAIGQALIVISIFFPALLLQDFWRFAAFSRATPRRAFFNDAVWAVAQALTFLLIWLYLEIKLPWMIAGWGAGALAGALFGLWQFQTRPGFGRETLAWLRENASLSGWFGLSSFFYSAGAQAVAVMITAIAGRAALGGLQSVQNLFGPAQLIETTSQSIGLPLASKARAETGPEAVRRIALRYALLVGFCMTLYAALVFGAGPLLLSKVFGKAFSQYEILIIPLTLDFLIRSWGNGAAVGLMASTAGRELARIVLLAVITQVAMVGLLVSRFGVVGAAWGLVLGASVRLAVIWLACTIVTRPNYSAEDRITLRDYFKSLHFWLTYRVKEYTGKILVGLADLLAKENITVLGDSHVRVFRHPMMKRYFPLIKFDVVEVGGATASGLTNPNSKTQAYNIFSTKLASLPKKSKLLLELGEVDTGFVIWYHADKYKCDVREALTKTVNKYTHFIEEASKIASVIVISAPLPTIEDDANWGEVSNLRKAIKASQKDRTELALLFNSLIGKYCLERGIPYINLDLISLGSNGMVLSSLMNMDPSDHHYNQATYARILAPNLKMAFHKLERKSNAII